jgi:hypothetical protein
MGDYERNNQLLIFVLKICKERGAVANCRNLLYKVIPCYVIHQIVFNIWTQRGALIATIIIMVIFNNTIIIVLLRLFEGEICKILLT